MQHPFIYIIRWYFLNLKRSKQRKKMEVSFYDPENGWLYTDAESYPLIYKQSNSSWHFYELGSHAPKYFYSYETELWEEWK